MSALWPIEKKKSTRVALHAIAWLLYGTFIFLPNYLTNPHIRIVSTIIFLIPQCATFYLSIFLLFRYKRMGVLGSVISFFIGFFVLSGFAYLHIYKLLPLIGIKMYSSEDMGDFVKAALLGYTQFYSYAVLYFYAAKSLERQKQVRTLEEINLKRELENIRLKQEELKVQKDKLYWECAFLRSQINPHFLHNSLNILYAKATQFSEELAWNIHNLSLIMRYSMESVEFESDKVSVQKELDYLQLLLEINNIRFDYSKTIDYLIEGKVTNQMIPPLSMITVVENAFKYGNLKDHPLTIKVCLEPGRFYFYCRNKKKKNNLELSSHSIGLTNLSKRLDMAFKGRYKMDAQEKDGFYTFELAIN